MCRIALAICLVAVLLALMPGAMADTRIMVISDPHYLASQLYRESGLFLQAIARGDGKVVHQSGVLLEALLAEVRQRRPDALVISGDLTFNGEALSHRELAEACGQLRAEDIPVWVIPGNHDINNPDARRFAGSGFVPAENVSPEAFGTLWRDCLQPTRTPHSFTYAVEVTDRVWLAMLDVSRYRDVRMAGGLFTEEHRRWLADLLARARDRGAAVIAVTHQSVLPHTDLSPENYGILGGADLAEMLRDSGVRLCLTGHIHIQHRVVEEGLTDVATGAFSIWPHRYGWVTVAEDGTVSWEMDSLSPENLPEGFLEESAAFFDQASAAKLLPPLEALDIAPAEREQMLRTALRFNREYFSGTLDAGDPVWQTDPGWALWQRLGDRVSFGAYMNMTFLREQAHAPGDE